MQERPLWAHVLDDDALTRGLGDPEARVLVEWLVERADGLAQGMASDLWARAEVRRLCRRGRAISRFIHLWCYECRPGAAGQLAVAEGFTWPLPTGQTDPCELMQDILDWETQQMQAA
jgi:hypothetical protein